MQFLKAIFLTSLFLLAGLGFSQATIFVGNIDASDGKIAVVIEDSLVLAYTCGGNSTWETQSSWFLPTQDSHLGQGSFTLSSGAGLTLLGLYSSETATGTLTLTNGTSLSWTAKPVQQDSVAGLYLFNKKDDAKEDLVGLIVTNELQVAGNIRRILTGLSSNSTLFQPVGLAQALPTSATDTLTVCYTLEGQTECNEVIKSTIIPLE